MTTYDSGTSPTTRIYTWDNDNRLVKVEPYASTPTTMTYNADGLRVGVHSNLGGNIKYVWDGQNVLHEMDGSTPVAAYTYKPDMYGDLLARRYITTTMFYNYDALGSTIGMTDDAKNLVDTYIYKAYGQLLAETGGNYNPYRWVGRYGYQFDNQLSLNFNEYYIRQRHYGPLVAAWLSRDPLGFAAGLNRYLYAYANPSSFIDPSGLFVDWDCAINALQLILGSLAFALSCAGCVGSIIALILSAPASGGLSFALGPLILAGGLCGACAGLIIAQACESDLSLQQLQDEFNANCR
jgi:RHS repeat-associated protein